MGDTYRLDGPPQPGLRERCLKGGWLLLCYEALSNWAGRQAVSPSSEFPPSLLGAFTASTLHPEAGSSLYRSIANPCHVSGRGVSITSYLPPARRSLWGSLSGSGGPPPPSRRAKGQSGCFDSIHTACPRAQRDLRTWQEYGCQEPPEPTVRTPRNPGCHRGYKTPYTQLGVDTGGGLPGRFCGSRNGFVVFILFTAYFIRGMGPTPPPPGLRGLQLTSPAARGL